MNKRLKKRASVQDEVIRREADEVLAEAARLRTLFGETAQEELVEMCILQLEALARKHSYLRRQAESVSQGRIFGKDMRLKKWRSGI
ncbi:MAG: hypothetical protein IJC53_05090 [Clostridia bacterium]|nr:hypothetical protein [Clostridia bacterium]